METLRKGAERLRLALGPRQLRAFETYMAELQAALRQRRIRPDADARGGGPYGRLTALSDPEAVQRRHFLEPLALLPALEEAGPLAGAAIDIGSGAGFPGLPVKIVRPQLRLTLLDSNRRRAEFLEALVAKLGLEGVTVVAARAEDAARDPEHRERYDLALARAVAPLPALVEMALPFLRVGGRLAAPKGSGAPREVRQAAAALEACGGRVESTRQLDVPYAQTPPTLVVVRKVAPTPSRFPRRAGIPAKRPLR